MKSDKSDKPAKSPGKVFDVRRPGKAPASPTSRPAVITGHKPAVQAQAAVSGVGESQPESLMNHKRKLEILAPAAPASAPVDAEKAAPQEAPTTPAPTEPITPMQEALAATIAATTIETPAPPAEKSPTPEISAPAPTPPAPAATPVAPEPQPSPTPEVPALQTSIPEPAPSPAAPPEQPAALSKPAEAEPEFEDLIVVSHHGGHASAWEVILIVVLLLILAAAVLDILLDLAILDLPIPHTNFFSE